MPRRRLTAVSLLLAALTLAAYWPVRDNLFLTIDDPVYVFNNEHVTAGLTAAGVAWALGATEAANWHPLTWISHMLDVELFGLDERAHHLVNLGWHAVNTLALFLLLHALTGSVRPSALAAALFAVHPLHVESVAWVAERKDVLSGFFWMAASLAYVRFVRRRGRGAYVLLLALFALGLMAKPMAVTLPLVFLLLDVWPLGRLRLTRRSAGPLAAGLIREKLPLLALAAASSVVTLVAQSAGKMVKPLAVYPLGVRGENALVSYTRYLGKAVWPHELAFPYPHPGDSLTWAQTGAAALGLAAVTAVAAGQRRRRPYLLTGWLWFLGTLVPVIGLVQVSHQAMADRYTYLPLVGLCVAFAWALAACGGSAPRAAGPAWAAAALLLLPLALMTRVQVGFWHDNMSLFMHTARVTGAANLARTLTAGELRRRPGAGKSMAGVEIAMGDEATARREMRAALEHYEKSLEFDPDQEEAHAKLGAALLHLRRFEEAARHYAQIVRLRPDDAGARTNLGLALKLQGKRAEALAEFEKALALEPGNGKALANVREITGGAPR